MIEMGYEMLLREGTSLVDAVIRSSPLYSSHAGVQAPDVVDAAERIGPVYDTALSRIRIDREDR